MVLATLAQFRADRSSSSSTARAQAQQGVSGSQQTPALSLPTRGPGRPGRRCRDDRSQSSGARGAVCVRRRRASAPDRKWRQCDGRGGELRERRR
eukprot:755106-Rhodomonas_salina.1